MKVGRIRTVWIIVKVVAKHTSAAIAKLCRRLKWLWYVLAAILAVYSASIGFRWAVAHGAKGGDFLQFSGGALGAGLAVAGARWLSYSEERRQARRDRAAIVMNLFVAVRMWEVVLRRNVSDPLDDVYHEGLLRQACEWAAKVLHLIEGEVGRRESSADIARASGIFAVASSLKRNAELFDLVNGTPRYAGFTPEVTLDKLDKLWFVLSDVMPSAYSLQDRYAPGSWTPEKIFSLQKRQADNLIRLAKRKGVTIDEVALRKSDEAFGEDDAWNRLHKWADEFRRE